MVDDSGLPGRIIAGRYRLTSKLGQGGMGSVWRAEHLSLGSDVAIKLIDPAVAGSPEVRARFVREAQAAAQLRSPHVVQIIDYGVDDETPFIAMELMVGETLSDRLDREGRLSPDVTARIVTEVSRALGKAHEIGIIHRDLKPDNIFLVHNDDSEIAKVLDFGVAKKAAYGTEGAGMTSTGAVLGTPYYMSPEQAEGLKDLDHRTDIWALGVITYECMVGVRPFDSETLGGLFLAICTRAKPVPSALVSDLPSGFDEWFERCTARLLPDRFATAREAASALRDVVSGKYVVAKHPAGVGVADVTLLGTPAGPAGRGSKFDTTGGMGTGAVPANTTAPNLSRTVGLGSVDEVPKRPLPVGLLAAAALLLVAGVGGFFALRSSGGEEEPLVAEQAVHGPADATPAAIPAPEPTPPPPAAVTPPPPAPVASAEPEPAPVQPTVKKPVRTTTKATTKPTTTTTTQPKADPPPATKPASTKPAPVNLGI
jgi:eukaryotic-like serine/threonine-protein kinase